MRRSLFFLLLFFVCLITAQAKKKAVALWPDGSPIGAWFGDTQEVDVTTLGSQYIITDYGVIADSTVCQTEAIQAVIDRCAKDGGGVVVIPEGTFLTGSLFFRPGTHLHLLRGAVIKGVDAITHYKIVKTRLEGQTLDYFAALINADSCRGFTISGEGTINGNGRRFWDEFWLRRKVNKKCTNLEALRPRLVYISNSDCVSVTGVTLKNSAFWTNHLYRCDSVRYINCTILAPTTGYPKAPSSDGIDLDVCSDVLIHGCHITVNDDGVCLKGGKGTFVDKDSANGGNSRVLVEDCSFGLNTGGGITLGSESFLDRNIIMRNCSFSGSTHILLFKMRPDTPQDYSYVSVDGMRGWTRRGVVVAPWTQFYNLLDRPDMPVSTVSHVTVKNVDMTFSDTFYGVQPSDKYVLSDFTFENIKGVDDPSELNIPAASASTRRQETSLYRLCQTR